MRPKQAATQFFTLLILCVQTQGKPADVSERELCEGCPEPTTGPSYEEAKDSQSQYLIRVHDTAAWRSKSVAVATNTSFTKLDLKPLNEYDVTILGDHGKLYSLRISDVQIGPGKIQNLKLKSTSDTTAELEWEPPVHQFGAIMCYSISLKMTKLLGCEDLGVLTPEKEEVLQNVTDTTAWFINLHPYANYEATVIAHTSVPGPPQMLIVQTKQSPIPTSAVSNLRFDEDQNRLRWDKPVDCTTITGATPGVMLFFVGVNDSTRNFPIPRDSTYYKYYNLSKLQLAPYEWYRVRVHVVRGYGQPVNRTHYQELIWRTLPAAPSAVRLLEVYELDHNENSISLRWAPPIPANGKIKSYHVSIGLSDKPLQKDWTIKASGKEAACKQWENYVCLENVILPSNDRASLNAVKVYAMNEGVAKSGAASTIEFTLDSLALSYKRGPSQPRKLTATLRSEGTVSLKWEHPQITYTKLKRFRIFFDVLDTNLDIEETPYLPIWIEYPVGLEDRQYSVEVRLQSSKKYRIAVAAINQQNFGSQDTMVEISVPEAETSFTPVSIAAN